MKGTMKLRQLKPLALTVRQLAQMCGCHTATVYKSLESGDLKIVKRNGRIMIPAAELDRWLGQTMQYVPKIKQTKAES
jgi:excisionase family DNA binding protein